MAMSSDDAFADEIVEIFVEEVGEVLEQIDSNLPIWEANFTNQAALKEVRRAFHTLKGSGRMVHAEEIGELSWSIESMLNRIIDGTLKTSPVVYELIKTVRKAVPAMLTAFQNKQSVALVGVNISDLIEQASNIVAGKVVQPLKKVELTLSPEMRELEQPLEMPSSFNFESTAPLPAPLSKASGSAPLSSTVAATALPVTSVDMVEIEELKERVSELSVLLNELKRNYMTMGAQLDSVGSQMKAMPKGLDPVAINKQLKAADQEIQELKYYIKASSEKMMSDVNDAQRRLDSKVEKELRNVSGLRSQLESEMKYMGSQLRLEFGGIVKQWAAGCALGSFVLSLIFILIIK